MAYHQRTRMRSTSSCFDVIAAGTYSRSAELAPPAAFFFGVDLPLAGAARFRFALPLDAFDADFFDALFFAFAEAEAFADGVAFFFAFFAAFAGVAAFAGAAAFFFAARASACAFSTASGISSWQPEIGAQQWGEGQGNMLVRRARPRVSTLRSCRLATYVTGIAAHYGGAPCKLVQLGARQ